MAVLLVGEVVIYGPPIKGERRLKKRSFLVGWDVEGVAVGGDLSFYLTEGVCTDSPRAPLPKRRDVVANVAATKGRGVAIALWLLSLEVCR